METHQRRSIGTIYYDKIPAHLIDGSHTFAVFDCETTGLSPFEGDRIVEIAVVKLSPAGRVIDEYVTLLNPQRDVGPTSVHGLTNRDVQGAPTFAEIAGDLLAMLDGAVLAGHNVKFDCGFLVAEFARIGIQLPSVPAICTMGLSRALLPDLPNHKLGTCCSRCGIALRDAHSALADTRATALLLRVLLSQLRTSEPSPGVLVRVSWPDWPTRPGLGKTLRREDVPPLPPPPLPYHHPIPAGRQAGARQGARFGFGLGCGFVSATVAAGLLIVFMGAVLFFWGVAWIATTFSDANEELKQRHAAEQARLASALAQTPPAVVPTPATAGVAPTQVPPPTAARPALPAAQVTISGLMGDRVAMTVATPDGMQRRQVGLGESVAAGWRVKAIERRPLQVLLQRGGGPDIMLRPNMPTDLPR